MSNPIIISEGFRREIALKLFIYRMERKGLTLALYKKRDFPNEAKKIGVGIVEFKNFMYFVTQYLVSQIFEDTLPITKKISESDISKYGEIALKIARSLLRDKGHSLTKDAVDELEEVAETIDITFPELKQFFYEELRIAIDEMFSLKK